MATGGFSLLCGRYEGVDQRIADHLVDEELSVGDFVLAGGELAALVVVEAVVRLLPGVLGNDESAGDESFSAGLLEYPQYTRPAEFRGWAVPEVLLSGDHAPGGPLAPGPGAASGPCERRPDLIDRRGGLTDEEVAAAGRATARCACCANTATIGEPRRRRYRPACTATARGTGSRGVRGDRAASPGESPNDPWKDAPNEPDRHHRP